MRTIVTGGAGFIGSHLADALLAEGHEVHVVDDLSNGKRENVAAGVTLHVQDIREPLAGLAAEIAPEVIFHLAAQPDVRVSVNDPAGDATVNVIGTINVLEAARQTDARVVFSSTGGAIYGECERPAREGDPRLPLSPYGTAKLAGEEYLAMFSRLYGARHIALRFSNVYGPRQNPEGEAGVVAIFLGNLRRGEQCKIFGTGSQIRDYVYVGDVVRAALASLRKPDAGVLNVGTQIETSVSELYAACRAVAGSDAEPALLPERPGEIARSVLDMSFTARELDFRPETSLPEGLASTWAHILAN